MKKKLKWPVTQAFQFLLSKLRNSKKVTQYELAIRSGFSRQYISLVESGKKMPTLNFIFCIAASFDIDVKDFLVMLAEKFSDYESMAK